MRGRLVGSASNFDVEHMGLGVRPQDRRGEGHRGTACVWNFPGPSPVIPIGREF